jgi:PII-like signaling protein
MKISGQAVLLRVFVGESDKLGHLQLYEAIVKQAPTQTLPVRRYSKV